MINVIWLKEKENFRKLMRLSLYVLISSLILEGLVRKLIPASLGLIVFFAKDLICINALISINKKKSYVPARLLFLVKAIKIVCIAFIPVIVCTLLRDPFLVPFGLKQYLLYAVVGVMVPLAFPPEKFNEFKQFCSFIAYTVVATTIIAILQNSLPSSHWLNKSVDGNSLEGFAAAGFLRVSSTFAFTAQYSMYLNLVCVFIAVYFCFPICSRNPYLIKLRLFIYPLLSICLIIGAFITGGRTAVLGCGACVFIGFILSIAKSPSKFIFQGMLIIVIFSLSLAILNEVKPEFFAAYNQRSSGSEARSHSEEVEGRLLDSFFGWTDWVFVQDGVSIVFGNGIGVMSNGSEKFSSYAQEIRFKLWTETDLATVVWEGGIYLIFLFYGLRLWVILKVFFLWKKINNQTMGIGVSFLLAYIIVIGLQGTLSTQPPLAIWWWLSVGASITIYNYYERIYIKSSSFLFGQNQIHSNNTLV